MTKLGFILITAMMASPALADTPLAARTLPAGTVITLADLALTDGGEPAGADAILGLQTRRTIYEGRKIAPSQLTAPTLVDRNQSVTIAYESPFLRIETEGRALSAGSFGQVIRVMNNNSRVVVSGRVAADGTILVRQN